MVMIFVVIKICGGVMNRKVIKLVWLQGIYILGYFENVVNIVVFFSFLIYGVMLM